MTSSARRLFLLLAVLASFLVVSAPAFATEEEAPVEDDAPAVVAPAPALEIPEDGPADTTPEWSYRFLVPVAMVLGALAVIGTIFMYFVRVTKNRYRVVE